MTERPPNFRDVAVAIPSLRVHEGGGDGLA